MDGFIIWCSFAAMAADKYTLKQAFSETVAGEVWKFMFDNENQLLITESRDAANRLAAFSALEYAGGSVLLKNKIFDESWRLNLAFAQRGYFYLTVAEAENSLAQKGIVAVHAASGQIAWQRFDVSFYDAWQQGVQVFYPNRYPRKLELLSYSDGQPVTCDQLMPVNNAAILPQLTEPAALPEWLSHLPVTGKVHHLIIHDHTLIAFHEIAANGMNLRLVVYKGDEILLDDILLSGIQKMQLETFIVQQNQLFYIRNRNEIVSYFVYLHKN